MITQVLHCPYCEGIDIVKHGMSPEGKQRYRCRACLEGRGRTFLLVYTYAGQSSEVKLRRTPLSRQFETKIKIVCYKYELKYTAAGVR